MPLTDAEENLGYYKNLRATVDGCVSDYVGYSEASLKRVALRTALSLPGRAVLEIGCGPNPITLFALASRGWEVIAVELSTDFCRNASELAKRHDLAIRFVNASADATTLESEAFDLVLLTEVLEHVPDEHATLREVVRVLRPGGRLIVSVPNERSLFLRYLAWRNGFVEENAEHLREYTVARLEAAVTGAGLRVERKLRVSATVEPPWRAKAAWVIDRVTVRPEWGLKAALVAVKP
jgi:2-polyprenyl-3-methyl-5-hydroxy-6-metoxy-1,4-benzoquinol methylase